jgi:hypothetical protein
MQFISGYYLGYNGTTITTKLPLGTLDDKNNLIIVGTASSDEILRPEYSVSRNI